MFNLCFFEIQFENIFKDLFFQFIPYRKNISLYTFYNRCLCPIIFFKGSGSDLAPNRIFYGKYGVFYLTVVYTSREIYSPHSDSCIKLSLGSTMVPYEETEGVLFYNHGTWTSTADKHTVLLDHLNKFGKDKSLIQFPNSSPVIIKILTENPTFFGRNQNISNALNTVSPYFTKRGHYGTKEDD